MICRECDHWSGERHSQSHHRCLHPVVGRVPSERTTDGTSTMHPPSCLLTGPEFGCVHFTCRDLDAMKAKDAERAIPDTV
jgi:hypothetical protein